MLMVVVMFMSVNVPPSLFVRVRVLDKEEPSRTNGYSELFNHLYHWRENPTIIIIEFLLRAFP